MSKIENILKWIGIARLILPTALIAAGVNPTQTQGITNTVIDAEQALGPGTGPQKLAAVVKGVTDGMVAKGVSPTTIASTRQVLEDGVSSAVKLVNDVHDLQSAHTLAVTVVPDAGQLDTVPPADHPV